MTDKPENCRGTVTSLCALPRGHSTSGCISAEQILVAQLRQDQVALKERLAEAEQECREWLSVCKKGEDEQIFNVVKSILEKLTADKIGGAS